MYRLPELTVFGQWIGSEMSVKLTWLDSVGVLPAVDVLLRASPFSSSNGFDGCKQFCKPPLNIGEFKRFLHCISAGWRFDAFCNKVARSPSKNDKVRSESRWVRANVWLVVFCKHKSIKTSLNRLGKTKIFYLFFVVIWSKFSDSQMWRNIIESDSMLWTIHFRC